MDDIDKSILNVIRSDARIPLSDLSRRINLSLPATSERLRKLERNGYIKAYVTILDETKFGRGFSCYCLVKLSEHSASNAASLIEFVKSCDDILECHHVTGGYNYLLKIATASTKEVESLIKRMQTEFCVSNTDTIIILDTHKDRLSVSPG